MVLKLLIKIMMDVASVMASFWIQYDAIFFWSTMSLAKEQVTKGTKTTVKALNLITSTLDDWSHTPLTIVSLNQLCLFIHLSNVAQVCLH